MIEAFEGCRGDSKPVENPSKCTGHRRCRSRPGVPEALRVAFCRWCRARFAVCQSCDRGQEHCGRACAERTRSRDLRAIRARYRRSEAGRANHCNQERRRRARRAAGMQARVGDQGGLVAVQDFRSPVLAAILADPMATNRVVTDGHFHCRGCRRRSSFVIQGPWRTRLRGRLASRATPSHRSRDVDPDFCGSR